MLPTYRVTTRVTRIEYTCWRLFTDGSFERHPDGTDAAGSGIAAVSPDNCVRILCGQVTCDPRHMAFLGATSCSNKTGERINFLIRRGERVRILYDQGTLHVLSLASSPRLWARRKRRERMRRHCGLFWHKRVPTYWPDMFMRNSIFFFFW